jgi:benzoyl-CoA reductase/2-hydroxyglutaryl-CoA dehydratase subunit BcrC/BadD/HgdB
MLKQILRSMVQPSAALSSEAASPQAVWMNEWARLMFDAYEPGKTVVYTSCYAFPGELLAVFDVAQFDFEFAAAMFGLSGSAVPRLTEAEGRGCPMDMCSLHRLALGGVFRDEFPKPDLLITTSYYCDQKTKTNDIASRLYGAEPLLLEVPSAITADSVRYVEKQLRRIAGRIAEVSGQRFDEDRLKEAVRSSNRARRSHLTLLELLKHRPAPWSDIVLIVYSIQARQFAGTPLLERLNQAFVRNMEQRIATAQLEPERHRVFWFAWVPVYATNIFEVFKAHHVTVPSCETLKVHWDEIDEQNPFEGLALKCLKNPFVGPHTRRVEDLETTMDEYHIDGALLFATPACRNANGAYRLLQDSLAELDIPLLTLDMDIGDGREYSPEQVRTRLEGFIEVLEQKTPRARPAPLEREMDSA